MQTAEMLPIQLKSSVVAVPPLARDEHFHLNPQENQKIIQWLERGGIRTLLYGGNANFYNISLKDFEKCLGMLESIAGRETLVIPSIGPSFGFMMDQIDILKGSGFPTVMILPTSFAFTPAGVATGIRKACESLGKKVVLYLKNEGYLHNADVARLVNDGLVSVIKYAIVRDNPAVDAVLSDLVDRVDPGMIMSGIGEQPAAIHMNQFKLGGFTSGCVCLAPRQSMSLLHALIRQDFSHAEHVRRVFTQLEDLRNAINPIRVLHEAVELAEIAQTGPHYPNLSPIDTAHRDAIWKAATMLRHLDLVAQP